MYLDAVINMWRPFVKLKAMVSQHSDSKLLQQIHNFHYLHFQWHLLCALEGTGIIPVSWPKHMFHMFPYT